MRSKAEPRVTYAEAGAAMRVARDRLLAVPFDGKTARYREIVHWVIVEVGSYSRTADTLKRSAVAAAFGVSEKTITRALQWGARNGVIEWSARGKGDYWLASLTTEVAAGTRDTSTGTSVPTPRDSSHVDVSSPPGQIPVGDGPTSEQWFEGAGAERGVAPAGEGSAGAESAERRLVEARLRADAGSQPDHPLLAEAVRPDSLPGLEPDPVLDDLTGVHDSRVFVALLDAVIQISEERLPTQMTARQLEMTVAGLREMVAGSDTWLGDAAFATFWSTLDTLRWNRPEKVTKPVEFVLGSVEKALRDEQEQQCG